MLFIVAVMPLVIFAQPTTPNRGNSLYGSQTPQSATPSSSNLTKEEQAFAASLSPMHQTVFTQQFSPQQRQNAMNLAQQKDPLNTTPGQITPDHSVEIIMQSSRNQNQPNQQQQQQPYGQQQGQQQQQQPYGQQQGQQPLPDQYQPQNHRRPNGQQSPYPQPGECQRY